MHRTVGGLLSGEIVRRHGPEGLPEGTVEVALRGSAGQSLGAWLAPGVTLTVHGVVNDYVGKGLSGGIVAVRPPADAHFPAGENVIAGNVALYGATSGRAFLPGSPASASPSATPARSPWWRAWATTAAST